MNLNKVAYRLILLIILLLFVKPAAAQSKSFYWEKVDVSINLLANGDLEIVEHQTLNFAKGQFSFGFRTIPTGIKGKNDGISNIRVLEGDRSFTESNSEQPGTFKLSQEGDDIRVDWYFSPTSGMHTYTFAYTVKNGIHQFEDGDQIFWQAIPADHPERINEVNVSLRMPGGFAPQNDKQGNSLVAVYINGEDAAKRVDISVEQNGRLVQAEIPYGVPAYQNLEIRVQIPPELIQVPVADWEQKLQLQDAANLGFLLLGILGLIGGPVGVLALWYTRGRDPDPGPVPDYLTSPPEGIRAAIAGSIVDESADVQDVVSVLVDLAERGYLQMVEQENHEYLFIRQNQDSTKLRPYEKLIFERFFDKKSEKSLSELRYKFASYLPAIQDLIYRELIRLELVNRSPESIRSQYQGFGYFGLVAAVLLFFLVMQSEAYGNLICLPIAGFLGSLIMLAISPHMPAKTMKGARVAAESRAFKKYLQGIEKYQDLYADPEESARIFAQYLPYAIAFGLEHSWLKKFSKLPQVDAPPWYIPHYPYYGYGGRQGAWGRRDSVGKPTSSGESKPINLENMSQGMGRGLEGMSTGLTRMLSSTAAVLQSTPPSSNSGGFSGGGGGFSGGGFSGGGGGGGMGFG